MNRKDQGFIVHAWTVGVNEPRMPGRARAGREQHPSSMIAKIGGTNCRITSFLGLAVVILAGIDGTCGTNRVEIEVEECLACVERGGFYPYGGGLNGCEPAVAQCRGAQNDDVGGIWTIEGQTGENGEGGSYGGGERGEGGEDGEGGEGGRDEDGENGNTGGAMNMTCFITAAQCNGAYREMQLQVSCHLI